MEKNTESLLNGLRDIHLPEPISFWPLAPGWYILAGLIAALLLLGTYFLIRQWQKRKRRNDVLLQIEKLEQRYFAAPTNAICLVELSILLRRIALTFYPREHIASLHGEAWLRFLDECYQTKLFTQGAGRMLLVGPYQEKISEKMDSIFPVIKTWLKQKI